MFAQLVPADGGKPITIDRDVSIVGRQEEGCDIVVERKSISKMHCILVKTDGLLFVRDLFSTNGTRVNGQRIVRGALLPGDTLSLAGEKFRVHLGPTPMGSPLQAIEQTVEMSPPEIEAESFGIPRPIASSNGHDSQPNQDASASSRTGMQFVKLPPGGIVLDGPKDDLVE